MVDATKAADKPKEKTKKLSEVDKYKLYNVHLQDRVFKLEKQIAQMKGSAAKLELENAELRTQIFEKADVLPFYERLGVNRSQSLSLHDDGTLTVRGGTPTPAPAPAVAPRDNGDQDDEVAAARKKKKKK